jgi:pimeloyl-ACP methyl ester carboxylesterase
LSDGQTPVVMSDLEPRLWRSPLLGEVRELTLAQGPLQYFLRGEGPVLVFAHGWLANANLWRKVVDRLAEHFTCISLDLPLGSHRTAMRQAADLSPDGCGALIGDVLEALDLTEVTLIGNDSGGAYSQIAVAKRSDRVARLVLNSCETPFDEFPPPPFDGLPQAARDTEVLGNLFAALRDREVRAGPLAYGLLIKHPIDELVSDSYALPCLSDPDVLRDTSKVMSTAASAPVHRAAHRLIAEWGRPVLFAWGSEDQVFPLAHAERYATEFRNAYVEQIADAYSFTPEDQPQALALAIERFATD